MTERKQKKKVMGKYKSRQEAEAHARRLKANGHDHVIVRKNSAGEWIVEILFLGLALGILGAALRR